MIENTANQTRATARRTEAAQPELRGAAVDAGHRVGREDLDLCVVGLQSSAASGDATHPDHRVVNQVEAVAELTTDGGRTQHRIRDLGRFRRGLEVLDELAEAHHCEVRLGPPLPVLLRPVPSDDLMAPKRATVSLL